MRLHQAMQGQLVAQKSMLAYFFVVTTELIGRMPDTDMKRSEMEVRMAQLSKTRYAWRN